jgi:hypothetical protein
MAATTRRARRRSTPPAARLAPAARGVLLLPLAFALLLGAFAWLPEAGRNGRLQMSIAGAAALLAVGVAVLWHVARGRRLRVEVSLRAQHYLQASMQATVLAYWGWYWRPVYDAVPLIAAQLAFAYAVDMLLVWSRRETYTLGFGPFPVIFSINLFLWFKPDWFYLQFCMIAIGFAAKELIRWDKGGRRTHIFNPSSFPLAIVSIGLILTGTSSWTFGPDIARTQFNPPYIYTLLFLVGLPGQYLFGVTTMTMSAVVTTYLFGLLYFAATGAYFFVDSYIPIAVFLGMHLLFTDPSTSPRTELGRIIFGILYGLANIALYALLRAGNVPAFYDKLLPVPILNLAIRAIDRAATSSWLSRLDPARLGASLASRRRHLAYMALWTATFVLLSLVDGVGDHHPGHSVRFWQQACQAGARSGCENLAVILGTYCRDGSGWACNEAGALASSRQTRGATGAAQYFELACTRGFAAGCANATRSRERPPAGPVHVPPALADWPVILRTGKGPIAETTPLEILGRACREDWLTACHSLGSLQLQGLESSRDPAGAALAFERACSGGIAVACSDLGLMHYQGDGVTLDKPRGLALLKRACDLGLPQACRWHRAASADN